MVSCPTQHITSHFGYQSSQGIDYTGLGNHIRETKLNTHQKLKILNTKLAVDKHTEQNNMLQHC